MATGEVGKKPVVHLYEFVGTSNPTGSFSTLTSISGLLVKGIAQLAFSPDGRQLFAVDLDYTVAIYDCNRSNNTSIGRMIASGQGPKGKIYHSTSLRGDKFISCGEKHLCIWSVANSRLTIENAKLGDFRNKNFLSCARLKVFPNLVVLTLSITNLLSVG